MQRVAIDPQHWAELSRLLDTALDLPPSEWDQWLANLDAQFEPLKPQLRALLSRAAAVETRDFLNTLPKLQDRAADTDGALVSLAGESVGPYRLIRELGAGGMGSVWLAERTDGLIKRPIALKLPHLAPRHIGLAERMAREREILATLTYSHIARLYDAGVTPEGRPYLALEYVEGKSILAYCEEHRLDVRARLRLFLQVANAVAYAHAKLIIHRDLKPANILVTSEGEARLLDFGVSKLLDDGRAESTQLTELSGRAMTLDYASPEQILGQPLTIATDIYSLGVVLYELLTGTRPYQLKRESRGALEDAIVQMDPARMSEVAPITVRKALRGDLDTIVLKALKKRVEDRYDTVNAFADDVLRHLEQRPVLARPDSTWYRLGRLVARNRVAVGAGAAVVIAILMGAGIAAWQARVAVLEGRRAEEVKQFIFSIFRDANLDADQSKPASVSDLLKQAGARLETLEAQPAVRVELLSLVGASLLSLGETDTMEQIVQRAIAEGSRSLGSEHPLTVRARLLMTRVHMYRGRTSEMRQEIEALMALMERNPETFAEEIVELWRVRADQALDAAEFVQAESFATEAVRRAEAKFGPRHTSTLLALGVLATAYDRSSKTAEALATAERAQRLALELFPGNSLHPYVVHARAEYGRALAEAGDLVRAVEQLELALADAVKLYGPNGRTVGFHLQNLAGHQLRLGSIKPAIEHATRALEILSQHAEPGTFNHVASVNVLSLALLAARRGSDALPLLTQTQDAAARIFGPLDRKTLITRSNRALALALTGDVAQARSFIHAVVADTRRAQAPPVRPFYVASVIETWAGQHERALDWSRQALTFVDGKDAMKLEQAQIQTQIGLALVENNAAQAGVALQLAIAIFGEVEQGVTPPHTDALIGLGRLRLKAGQGAEALPLLEKADGFWREFDAESRWAGEAALWLGRAYLALGRKTDAAATLSRAEALLARSPFPADAALRKLAALR